MRSLSALLGICVSALAIYAAEAITFTAAQRSWWAFQPVAKPAAPAVRNKKWVKTAVDAFILAKLEAKDIQPNPPADKLTLLHRATIDMTGLAPTPDEIQQFLVDNSPTAWEKVVDRLLASPAYGERWGRHWLDIVRYADYVIQSFNSDKPYNRFVKEQIAGDELYPGDPDALVAMGYNRNWIDESNAASMFV